MCRPVAGPHAALPAAPHAVRPYKMLTARETISPIVTSERTD